MTDCSIHIFTRTEEETLHFCAKGEFFRTESGFTVFYDQDGERVSLRVESGEIFLERPSLSMRFCAGERTSAVLRLGGQEGEIPVFTRDCSVEGGDIFLCYELIFPEDSRLFLLEIKIQSLSEAQ